VCEPCKVKKVLYQWIVYHESETNISSNFRTSQFTPGQVQQMVALFEKHRAQEETVESDSSLHAQSDAPSMVPTSSPESCIPLSRTCTADDTCCGDSQCAGVCVPRRRFDLDHRTSKDLEFEKFGSTERERGSARRYRQLKGKLPTTK
jgi:hypothetical protein